MSDFSSKFAQLSVRSEKSSHNDLSNIQRANGDEDKGSKGNPWKPSKLFTMLIPPVVPSSENNSLEADAWPEPSAPTEQRRITRIAEEKPKRKLKWHNYEVDDTTCGFPRGRGRHTVGPFAGANYTSSNVRPFRRGKRLAFCNSSGYGGYRSRILPDANRGRNSNGFYRHPGRLGNVRPVSEPKENPNEPSQKNSPVQASDTCSVSVDVHLGTDVSAHDEKVSDRGLHLSESVDVSGQQTDTDLQNNKPSSVSSMPNPTPRKVYRERSNVSSQSGSQSTNIPSNYDAGPVGRARRSYQRQHQPMFPTETDSHNLNSHSTLVANSSIQPLIPFQTLPQIAYIIPGAPATMLTPALQIAQTPASHTIIPTVSLPNTQILPTQPTIQHPIGGLPHLPVENLPIPILPDGSAVQSVHPSFNPQSSITSTGTEQPVDTPEVVDVTQVIAYINEVGWKKVVFPTSLREHRAVAAAIKDALGSSNHDLADLTESAVNKNDLSNPSSTQPRSDDAPTRPIKADDVIIVEDRVFFVPKNVNRTKFLKFLSKLDYIKHHVEYYFSESNLQRDSHLRAILTANQDVCPLSELLQFNRLRWVSATESELLDAVSSSNVLLVVLSPDGSPAGITRVCPTLVKHFNEGCPPSVEFGYVRPVNQGVSLATSVSDQNTIVVQVSSASGQSLTHPSVDPSNQNISILSPVSAHSFGSQVSANSNNAPFPCATQVLGVSGQSMSSLPHNSLPNYIQSSAHVLTPNNFGILTNTSPGNMIYSSSSPSQQHASVTSPFYQSDLGPQSTIRPAQAFHCQQLYTQNQAAAFMAAAANQCSLLASGPSTTVLPPSDPSTASFISALYRLATPGSPAPIVGTYVPSVGNPNMSPAAPNSAVFLQFIPGAHPGQTNAYFAPPISCPPGTNSLLSRSVPAHASGMWIPLNQGSGANGGIVPTLPYQPYVALTQAHPSLSLSNNPSGNGGLYAVTSSHSFPTAFGTVPTLTIGPDVSGFGVQKVFSHAHSLSSPHSFTNHQSPVTSNANVTAINTPTGHTSQINVNHSSVPGSQPSNSNLALGKRIPTNNTQT
ncbi:unnamed protein product [Schistosoma margrebowiei]|uniref:HTH La-type RNA-binding domain-containing protein n=1 Tax=Schistosoma margrebowiei TaxID=48269 RepID=A0AA84ZFP7_9TREM|nr:unnamed protein product [Schistosoma margrebowiei]